MANSGRLEGLPGARVKPIDAVLAEFRSEERRHAWWRAARWEALPQSGTPLLTSPVLGSLRQRTIDVLHAWALALEARRADLGVPIDDSGPGGVIL